MFKHIYTFKTYFSKFISIKKFSFEVNVVDKISKDLKKKGMKFVGSITIYSYLEAIGIIDNHTKDCFKY